MVLRFPFSRFVFVAPAIAAATPVLAAPPLATSPAITFFSSVTEAPLARLEAASIAPRYVRHGPFRVPAPGVEIESPTLSLQDQPCTPEDWARLLKELAVWRQLPGATDFLLTLPDGRVFIFLHSPSIGETSFSGFVRPLASDGGKPSEPLLLRIAHDGAERLRIDLRPLPKARSLATTEQIVPDEAASSAESAHGEIAPTPVSPADHDPAPAPPRSASSVQSSTP